MSAEGSSSKGKTIADVANALTRLRDFDDSILNQGESAEAGSDQQPPARRIRRDVAANMSSMMDDIFKETATLSWAENLVAERYGLDVAQLSLVSVWTSGSGAKVVLRHDHGSKFTVVRDDAGVRIERMTDAYPPRASASILGADLPDLNRSESDLWDSSGRAIFRRLRGEGRVTGDGQFELDGVSVDKWFASLGLEGIPRTVQEATAELFCVAVSGHSGTASVGMMKVSFPPNLQKVFNTAIFLRVKEVTQLRTAVTAGLIANLLMHSPPIALGASVLAALWDNVRHLSERELEVLRTMTHLTRGRPYKSWIEQEQLLHAMPPPMKGEGDNLDTLIRMQSRGLLEETAGRWRAVF